MNTISAATAAAQRTGAAASDSKSATVDYDQFLKLLVATMQKQDPTQPNDPAETLSQLASFSNVEQSIKLNDKLDRMLTGNSLSQGAALFGRKVSSLDGSVSGLVTRVDVSSDGISVLLDSGKRISADSGLRIES